MDKHVLARLQKPIQFDSDGKVPPGELLVLPVGEFKTWKGDVTITDDMLASMVNNFQAGIPADKLAIDTLHEDGPAPGWIEKLTHKVGEGLYVTVKWTKYGKELLMDELYRFVSAEFWPDSYVDPTFGKEHGPTLTGMALTNKPMLQNIPALMSSAPTNEQPLIILYSQEGASMNLDEIRAKDAAQLSEDEKTFLQDHAADLNDDERTKFGIEAPAANNGGEGEGAGQGEGANSGNGEGEGQGNGEGEGAGNGAAELSQGKSGEVTLSATRLAALEKAANDGQKAMVELNQQRMSREVVEPLLFSAITPNGRFLPKSKENLQKFVFSLNDSQRAAFSALMNELPKTLSSLTKEVGDGGSAVDEDASSQLLKFAQSRVAEATKAGQKLELSVALDQVTKEHPELEREAYGVGGSK